MTEAPDTRYVRSGDAHIAYQVVGDGPVDLVVVRGYISHVETAWESPALAGFYRRLTSFCRLILFDKRGTGLSDRVPEHELPTLEQRMDDVRAVMDAAGSQRAALLASSEGGPMCLLFAATFPERTRALVLWGCFAQYDWRRSFIGRYWGGDTVDEALARLEAEWGDGGDLASMAPSLADDDAAITAWGRAQRLSATPGTARALLRMMLDIDVRPILPSIRVPVLVLQRVDDVAVDACHSRYLAEHIPSARYLELPGADHLFWVGELDPVVAEMQEFLTGIRPPPEPDRVVATVMYTDAAPHVVRTEVERFRGSLLGGDDAIVGASFDGPARAIRCATSIVGIDASARAGLHTGECAITGDLVEGVAVAIARRVYDRSEPGEVLVSRTIVDLVAGSGIEFIDRGTQRPAVTEAPWQLCAVAGSDAPTTSVRDAQARDDATAALSGVLRREGDVWFAEYDGTAVRLRSAKGLQYLARLVAEPGREFHALDLAGAARAGVMNDTDAGALLDPQAKAAYRRRLTELRTELHQAEEAGNATATARAQTDIDFLGRELAAAVGLGGRDRVSGSAAERARQAVAKAIRGAIDRIGDRHPRLGEHLAATVHTGTFCSYQPLVPVMWDTTAQ